MIKTLTIKELSNLPSKESLEIAQSYIFKNMEEIEQYNFIIEEIKNNYSVYEKETKAFLNELSDILKEKYPDYRRGMIKESKKLDLPKTLTQVLTRTIQHNNDYIAELEVVVNNSKKQIEDSNQKELFYALSERVQSFKNEFIDGFESLNEGREQWDSVISLIEDGYIKEGDLAGYGIHLK